MASLLNHQFKSLLISLILICVIFIWWTSNSSHLTQIEHLLPFFDADHISEIAVAMTISSMHKEYTVSDDDTAHSIVEIIEDLTFKEIKAHTLQFDSAFYKNYRLVFTYKDEAAHLQTHMMIHGGKYLNINGTLYQVKSEGNISQLYALVILSQPEGVIDQYYVDLIESIK